MVTAGAPGFRILAAPARLHPDVIASFNGMAASNLADAMGRFHFMDPGMRARGVLPLCGLAVTVCCRPADNLMVHKAVQYAEPGDVIVVNTCGNTTSAVFGELMCRAAVAKGLGGIVVDGAIRDIEAIRQLGLPAFSRTVSAGGCDKDGPGEINVPISCGGTVVAAGDIVVGDADGVVVVPREQATEVLEQVKLLMEREQKRIAEIDAGGLFRPDVDALLREKGIIE
ncbi:MAG: RraA family protein [Longimicrobiales bacterium]